MMADVPALMAALKGIRLFWNIFPGKCSNLPQAKCGSWPPTPAPPPGKCLVVSATELDESFVPWKPVTISCIILPTHAAFSPNVPSTLCHLGSVAKSAMYMYPFLSPTAAHSCLAMSANSWISFRSLVAESPSSPGQVEKVVVPTLSPIDASLVI